MKKYILVSVFTETMNIEVDTFNTLNDAHSEMEKQYNEMLEDLKEQDLFIMDNEIDSNSALLVSDYEYYWDIKEIEV